MLSWIENGKNVTPNWHFVHTVPTYWTSWPTSNWKEKYPCSPSLYISIMQKVTTAVPSQYNLNYFWLISHSSTISENKIKVKIDKRLNKTNPENKNWIFAVFNRENTDFDSTEKSQYYLVKHRWILGVFYFVVIQYFYVYLTQITFNGQNEKDVFGDFRCEARNTINTTKRVLTMEKACKNIVKWYSKWCLGLSRRMDTLAREANDKTCC